MRLFLAAAIAAALALPAAATAGTVFLLDGRGWGHGVGMSQWGAEGYARHGYGYKQILAHYYPHTHIGIAKPRDVRVLLQQGVDKVRIGAAAPFVVVDARGRKLHLPARSVVIDRRFTLRHRHLAQPLSFEPGAQPLEVNFAGYRGNVVIKAKPDGLMAVNVLPLDRYLRGVVPWEAPAGWHTVTYEAQAVAARSYTLATLHPNADFDLYPDQRSQMYGGIRAERTETNLAIGATAGQVLVWRDTIIPAYYFSSSGGRTSSIHDEWPKAHQVPYLVSVSDPYDYISPHHIWPTTLLTAAQVGAALHVSGVRDMQVLTNSSGRAHAVRVLTAHGPRVFTGEKIRDVFALGSTDFVINAMGIDPLPARALFGSKVKVTGFVRGLGRARLQEETSHGWVTARTVHVAPDGRFALTLPARRSTELRRAYNSVAGGTEDLNGAPRVKATADGATLRAVVSPYLPLKIERLTDRSWRPVARGLGSFARRLRPGSYRVAVLGGTGYASVISRPVAVRLRVSGP